MGPGQPGRRIIYDVPQMFGTRRIGPDLSREGNRRSDEWHYAHHWDPRAVEPESMMPAYSWLFTEDMQHDRAVTAFIETYEQEPRRASHEIRIGCHRAEACEFRGTRYLAGKRGRQSRRRHHRHA